MPKPVPTVPRADSHNYEEETVHEVYEAIAPHFARTRYKVSRSSNGYWKSSVQWGIAGLGAARL